MKYLFTRTRLVFIALLLLSSTAMAQFTATGKVTDANGEPLIGVTVLAKGTTSGTVTDVDGTYSLRIAQEPATLVFSYTGYSEMEKQVSRSAATVNVTMTESSTILSEVVVTGLASSIKRSNAANSVATIDSKDLTGVTVQSTTDGALYGKFTGVNISANSGAPGGGTTVKLRGITTLNAESQPLYIVDGVYYDNSSIVPGLNTISKAAGQGSTNFQDNQSSRIADLDPEDIERIEILKGASAAAIYGSRAASGVIIITTKRGKTGKPTVSISQSVGFQQQLKKLGVRDWDAAKVEAAYGPAQVPLFEAAKSAGKLYNYEDEMYGEKGVMTNTRFSIGGGSETTKYFVGMTHKTEDGIVKNTGYDKTSIRLNLDQQLWDFMDLSVSSNYVNSSADRGYFNNDNTSTTMGVSFVSTPSWAELHADANGNYPNNPFAPSNFLQTRDLITNNEGIERFLVGGALTTRLITADNQSLKLMMRGGLDYYTLTTTALFPRELQFQKDGNGTDGASVFGTTGTKSKNYSAFLVHDFNAEAVSFKTQLGVTQEELDLNTVLSTATFLIGTQTNLDQAGSVLTEQNTIDQTDKGFFGQEEINWQDKVIATFGVRGDKSSRNGDPNKLYYYPKGSLAVNLHEFGLGGNEMLSLLKLRGAFGQSGNFAPFGAIYNPLVPVIIGGSTGSLIGTRRGNPDIEPERQTEIEVGADLSFLKNKLNLELTYYIKNVEDLIIPVQLPPSSGFDDAWQNAADIENTGVELALDAYPITGSFSWHTRAAFWLNRAEVTRLDVPAYNVGAFGATLGTYRIEEGKSPTQLVGRPLTEGIPTVFGNAEPDFQMSFNNNLTYGNWDLNFLFHWKKGGDNVNLSTLLSDIFGTSPDFDQKSLDPAGQLTNGNYRLSTLGVSADAWIEDASYIRLREASLGYKIPRSKVKNLGDIRLAISGRNLINIFDYNSYDPEVSNFGTNALSSAVEVTPFPSSKSYHFTVGITF
ncbi:MAG: SusC/RagA family TonB-linked outer membrane protein [Bacteroidetes bacterium]|nr:SusC/RagA family TonB-linked outer membrane protein [Bacteroidota bacterium]